jgi:hypothetical protein
VLSDASGLVSDTQISTHVCLAVPWPVGIGVVREPYGCRRRRSTASGSRQRPPTLLEVNFDHLGPTRQTPEPAMGWYMPSAGRTVLASCMLRSSGFPTYGCSNPALTVVAMGLGSATTSRNRWPLDR